MNLNNETAIFSGKRRKAQKEAERTAEKAQEEQVTMFGIDDEGGIIRP